MVSFNSDSVRRAAAVGITGALITAVGGAVVQLVVQPSTTVSDEMWSYPWSSDALVPVSLLWAVAHVLVAVGILGLQRSAVTGPTRAGRGGLWVALVGTGLLFVGELGSVAISDARVEDTSAMIIGTFFGVGTLLSAVGFLLAGTATLSAATWRGWRRYAALITGLWTTVLLGLSFTKALPAGVGIYGLCLLALFWRFTHSRHRPPDARSKGHDGNVQSPRAVFGDDASYFNTGTSVPTAWGMPWRRA